MEDELEDKLFYETFVLHMKILSKFAVGASSMNSTFSYIWKLCRLYILRPEVILCGVVLFILLFYLQAVDTWSRSILQRIHSSLGQYKSSRAKFDERSSNAGDYQSWEEINKQSSAFAVLGRRPRMEDRFIIDENINNTTGISFFAVFDGHGGDLAADFAKDVLVKNIYNKIIEITNILSSLKDSHSYGNHREKNNESDKSQYLKRNPSLKSADASSDNKIKQSSSNTLRTPSFRKAHSDAEDCLAGKQQMPASKEKTADVFTAKLNSLMRNSGNNVNSTKKDSIFNNSDGNNNPPPRYDAKCYVENNQINFGKLITDEIMSADYQLVEKAKRSTNIAGTTALIALIYGTKLIVANVGDSRGVMCDSRGMAVPLSFDHKPQQVRERKRILDAGGFIAFRGVWRVAGILATSRALGDYPLKDKNLVIANPDILTFELNEYKPNFIILASDGLWDTFTNEEACTFVNDHIKSHDFGAKSLAMQSYQRGSVDNITVIIIVFRDGVYRIGSSLD